MSLLTKSQIGIVKATIPILESSGEALTTHFYKLLLKNDTVRPLFNSSHQATGAQPRALANSVLEYAKNIETLENLGPLAAQIVNKHVALNVQPEHYPIVGQNLIRAIREVLGADTATEEVLQAWAAAYTQLADILIAAEAKAYDDIAAAPGGWRGTRPFKVVAKTAETPYVSSFTLAPVDGKPVVQHKPGQYITLLFEDTAVFPETTRRNYSVSQAADGSSLRVTVKRQDGASLYLHEKVNEGDVVPVFPPAGCFHLDHHNTKPLVLVSAGVGITPMLPMLQAATRPSKCPVAAGQRPTRSVAFINYAQTPEEAVFAREVFDIVQAAPQGQVAATYVYSQPATEAAPATGPAAALASTLTGRICADHMRALLPAGGDVDAYLVGPKPFMVAAKRALVEAGVPVEQIKWEFFGPAEAI